ncbi:DNA gyrase subunit A, partial [Burkholderia pseudomallei]
HRREVLTRRTDYELRKERERGHVLEGLAVALANIHEFIAIIKPAQTPPIAKQELMAKSCDSSLVRDMLTRAETENAEGGGRDAYLPEGLSPAFGIQG